MTTDPERIKRLEVASAFCLFDKKLRSSGNGSIVWGVLNLSLGACCWQQMTRGSRQPGPGISPGGGGHLREDRPRP